MRAVSQRAVRIQKLARPGDDAITADRVIVATSLCAAFLWNDIGAIEGVIQTPPTSVCCIERVARVHDGHNQLGARNVSNLWVDVLGGDTESGRRGL